MRTRGGAGRGRRLAAAATLAAALAGAGLGAAQTIPGASPESAGALARGEWPTCGGTYASAKYSPLDQITPANVASLRVAWRWTSPDHALRQAHPGIDPSFLHESTPVMVNGVLYTSTSLSQVAAIDAATAQTKWVFDPGVHGHGMPANNGWLHRGVAYHARLAGPRQYTVLPGITHYDVYGRAFDEAMRLAIGWYDKHLK